MTTYSPTDLEAFVRQRAPEIMRDITEAARGSRNEADLVAAAERILSLPKWIDAELQWRQNENGDWIMRAPVLADEQIPLTWYVRFNPRTGNYTSILFWQQINPRRLDVGKRHHNPDCRDVGRMHKHRWTDAVRDHMAYEPGEMSQQDDVGAMLQKFLAECEVTLRVPVHNPPAASQRDLGL